MQTLVADKDSSQMQPLVTDPQNAPVPQNIKLMPSSGIKKKKSKGRKSPSQWLKETLKKKKQKKEEEVPAIVMIKDSGMETNKDTFVWSGYGGTKYLSIHNDTDSIHAVKIRCSDNALFRITPPLGTILPRETLTVKIHRTRAPIKPDKIVVLAIPTVKEEKYLEELFSSAFVPHIKVSITQLVEGQGILAYHAPLAPSSVPCLKFNLVKLLFNGEVGGNQNLRITNSLRARIGIKVQCTDNNLFEFRPVFGIIERNETLRIKVTRRPHPRKRDKMIVCATILKQRHKEAHLPRLFLKKSQKITEISIPLTCT